MPHNPEGWVPPSTLRQRGDCVPRLFTTYEVQKLGNSATGNGLALVSQAEFARMKGVSRKTVTEWKTEKRLVFAGKLVDVAASQAALLRHSSGRSVGKRAPVTQAADRARGNSADGVTGNSARYADGADYGNAFNLPDVVMDTAVLIEGGAIDMARLLRPHMPMPLVQALVMAWVTATRHSYVGGVGLPASVADVDWPIPPLEHRRWSDHPLFLGDPLKREWDEVEADHAAGKLPKVTA